jgi:hypothetical protein
VSITLGVLLAGIADYKAEAVFGVFPPRVRRTLRANFKEPHFGCPCKAGEAYRPHLRTPCFEASRARGNPVCIGPLSTLRVSTREDSVKLRGVPLLIRGRRKENFRFAAVITTATPAPTGRSHKAVELRRKRRPHEAPRR